MKLRVNELTRNFNKLKMCTYLDTVFPQVLRDLVYDYLTAVDITIIYPEHYIAYLEHRLNRLTNHSNRIDIGSDALACLLITRQCDLCMSQAQYKQCPPYIRYLLFLYNRPPGVYGFGTKLDFEEIEEFIPYPGLFNEPKYAIEMTRQLLTSPSAHTVVLILKYHSSNINQELINLCLDRPHVDVITWLIDHNLVEPTTLIGYMNRWLYLKDQALADMVFEYCITLRFDGHCKHEILSHLIKTQSGHTTNYTTKYVRACLDMRLYQSDFNYITLGVLNKLDDVAVKSLLNFFQPHPGFKTNLDNAMAIAVEKYPRHIPMLLQIGADINLKINGKTPLSRAVVNDDIGTVKLLIEARANPMVKVDGTDIINLAREYGHRDIYTYLTYVKM